MQKLEARSSAEFLALTEEQKSDFKKLRDKQEADLADISTSMVLAALTRCREPK